MEKKTDNEMEQIQKGLERFLEYEVEGMSEGSGGAAETDEREPYGREMEKDPAADPEAEEDRPAEEPEEDAEEDFAEEPKERVFRKALREGRTKDRSGGSARKEANAGRAPDRTSERKRAAGEEENMRKKKKRHSGLKKLLVLIAVVLALFFGGLYLAAGVAYDRMNHAEGESAEGALKKDGVTSLLLIGSDSRTAGTEGRSDAMILLTISDRTKSVHMTSLLRDMYVEIPGHDGNRLNAAYAYGGPELLMETVNQNFGTEVSRYAVVNFEAFANLVDAVGGVELELTNEEVQWVNAYLNEYNELRGMPMETDYLDTSLSGNIHLNGAQALAYCRNRYIGTDFARTQRQRNVLSAVLKKLPAALVTNPGELVDGLFANLTTDLSRGECMKLLLQDSLPLDGSYSNATIREMSVLQVDFDQNRAYIRREIYGEGE